MREQFRIGRRPFYSDRVGSGHGELSNHIRLSEVRALASAAAQLRVSNLNLRFDFRSVSFPIFWKGLKTAPSLQIRCDLTRQVLNLLC